MASSGRFDDFEGTSEEYVPYLERKVDELETKVKEYESVLKTCDAFLTPVVSQRPIPSVKGSTFAYDPPVAGSFSDDRCNSAPPE